MLEEREGRDIYEEGLIGTARERGLTLEEAARLTEQKLQRVKATEHVRPVRDALKRLTTKDGDKK